MTKKEVGTELISKSGDWKGFLAEFQDESDRATAILGGVFLDEHLRQLIANALAGEKGIVDELLNGPLQSFANRIKLAYCLKLINASEYADIQLIRDIRNSFAHRLDVFRNNDFIDATVVVDGQRASCEAHRHWR